MEGMGIKKFTDAWEQRKFGEFGEIVRTSIDPKLFPNDSFMEYSMPAYDNGRQPQLVMGNSMLSSRLKIVGDVLLVNKLNVRQKRIWHIEEAPGNAVASGEFMPFASTKIDLTFLEHLMLSDSTTSDLQSMSSGTSNSQKRIVPSDLLKYKTAIPIDRNEQIRIGTFFSDLDHLITLHQREPKCVRKYFFSLIRIKISSPAQHLGSLARG